MIYVLGSLKEVFFSEQSFDYFDPAEVQYVLCFVCFHFMLCIDLLANHCKLNKQMCHILPL